MLDGTFHRTGAEVGVVALLCQELDGLVGNLQLDALRFQHVRHPLHLQAHHVGYLLLRQLLEGDNLVDTVQELRSHGHPQLFAGGVRRHDDDRVLEVGGTSLVVRQPAVVQHLQQNVEHVGVGLLNLVKQHHAVGLAAYSLCQLTTLVVAYVARRRTHQSRDGMLLLVFRHVDTRHHRLVVEQVLGQGLCQLGLTDTRGAEEDERGNGALRVLQSGT